MVSVFSLLSRTNLKQVGPMVLGQKKIPLNGTSKFIIKQHE